MHEAVCFSQVDLLFEAEKWQGRSRCGSLRKHLFPGLDNFFLPQTDCFCFYLNYILPLLLFLRQHVIRQQQTLRGSQHKSLFLHHDSCQFHVGDGSNSYLLYPGVGAGPTRFHEKKSHKTSHHDMTLQVSLEAACITVYLLEHITWST